MGGGEQGGPGAKASRKSLPSSRVRIGPRPKPVSLRSIGYSASGSSAYLSKASTGESAAALTWIVLMAFRVVSWSRQHPLLGQMYKLQYGKGDDDADFDRIALGEAVVRHYLPPNERDPLLARLDDAKTRTEKLLGLPS